MLHYPTLDKLIGNTPLVKLQRLPGTAENTILAKLEGNNPAGSVKDRPALGMIRGAEERAEIKPGDTLIEATSGNTGIALAMVAAARGYSMVLIMPEHMSMERRAVMQAFGAEIVLVSKQGGMEEARDLADAMQARGEGRVLDQFANADNPRAHYETTGPEIWRDTQGRITHFVSAMGTTGTIMGVSRFLGEVNPEVQIVGVQPADESSIPGIRKWPQAYLPKIFEAERIDRIVEISAEEAEQMTLELGRREGIFAGISSGGAVSVALALSRELRDAVIVTVICDRGDRYLSTGLFDTD
ncbi:MAG: cysteine synthase B [Gammaproteobacteria bacterium]|nr:MAG: cysteine synthase B [Gammaproteobacteria bacterium]